MFYFRTNDLILRNGMDIEMVRWIFFFLVFSWQTFFIFFDRLKYFSKNTNFDCKYRVEVMTINICTISFRNISTYLFFVCLSVCLFDRPLSVSLPMYLSFPSFMRANLSVLESMGPWSMLRNVPFQRTILLFYGFFFVVNVFRWKHEQLFVIN